MNLTNVATIKAEKLDGKEVSGTSRQIDGVEGYFLDLKFQGYDEIYTLSTYLSDKPRLFKRSDALLKEAKKLGLTSVTFKFI